MFYFSQLIKEKDFRIASLEAQVERLLRQVSEERERANNAVDELLRSRGENPITPPPPISREQEKASRILEQAMSEFRNVGEESA